jgi:hypothetical protein
LVDIDTLQQAYAASNEGIDILNAPFMQSADLKYFTMYSLVDGKTKITTMLIDRDNELLQFDSKWVPIFEITEIINNALEYFISRERLMPLETEKMISQADEAAQSQHANLPTIPSWSSQILYTHAMEGLKFSLGGLAIGLSASFVSVGTCQMYKEAEFRNAGFAHSSSGSGIVAGVSIAITSEFLAASIFNIVSILTYSH